MKSLSVVALAALALALVCQTSFAAQVYTRVTTHSSSSCTDALPTFFQVLSVDAAACKPGCVGGCSPSPVGNICVYTKTECMSNLPSQAGYLVQTLHSSSCTDNSYSGWNYLKADGSCLAGDNNKYFKLSCSTYTECTSSSCSSCSSPVPLNQQYPECSAATLSSVTCNGSPLSYGTSTPTPTATAAPTDAPTATAAPTDAPTATAAPTAAPTPAPTQAPIRYQISTLYDSATCTGEAKSINIDVTTDCGGLGPVATCHSTEVRTPASPLPISMGSQSSCVDHLPPMDNYVVMTTYSDPTCDDVGSSISLFKADGQCHPFVMGSYSASCTSGISMCQDNACSVGCMTMSVSSTKTCSGGLHSSFIQCGKTFVAPDKARAGTDSGTDNGTGTGTGSGKSSASSLFSSSVFVLVSALFAAQALLA